MSNWSPFAPNGFKAIVTGATVVFFAYVGFDAVANSAEESRRPQVCQLDIDVCAHCSDSSNVLQICCIDRDVNGLGFSQTHAGAYPDQIRVPCPRL